MEIQGSPHSKREGGEIERERERWNITSSLSCIRFTDTEEATMLWKLVENVKYEDIYEVTFLFLVFGRLVSPFCFGSWRKG